LLKGIFKYGGFIYDLRAYDLGDAITLYLSSPMVKGRVFLDGGLPDEEGEIEPATWSDLYISIGAGSMKVSSRQQKIGKTIYKSLLNTEALSKLGQIIRGMKVGCSSSNMELGGELFNSGFTPMKTIRYTYPNNSYIETEVGVLQELEYYGPNDVSLRLTEDYTYSEKIFQEDKTHQKLKLDLSEFVKYSGVDVSWDMSGDRLYTLQEIIERNPDKDYAWLQDRKYHVVTEIEDVERVCKLIWNHKGLVAFDTETTGLTVNLTSRRGEGDRLVGMVFAIEAGEAYYFPVAHKKIKNICNEGNEQFIIEKYFKPILEKKDLLCQNGSYDWKVMHNYGICINIVHDLLILMKVTMWNDHRNMSLGLKPMEKFALNKDSLSLSDFTQGKFGDEFKFWDLDEESTKFYACPDTDLLLEVFQWAVDLDLLGQYDAHKIYEIEVLFSIVIAYQEYYGHYVDMSKIDELVEAIKQDKEVSYKKMVDFVGVDFNPKSTKDLPNICFNILDLPVVEVTGAGNNSTGKDTRKSWLRSSAVSEEKKDFIKNLNRYLDARTLESNFTKNLSKFATNDGLMFSEVHQFLETGRVSTSNPNYQGYSDVVKKYVGPRPGFYAGDADYSSVEARIMVSMAGCKPMIEKMRDPDADFHRLKASDMFGVPYELVTDPLRKMAKGVNFGILYGLGDPNLGLELFGKKTPDNTRKAKKQKALYFVGMEELRGFIETAKEQGISKHFSTTYFKRRRYYDFRTVRKDTIERQSCNAKIQGTAADIYKQAMVRLFIDIKNRGMIGKFLISAFVHDEGFFEIHKSIDPMLALSMTSKAMMLEIDDWCPLYIGAGFGRTWYEAKHTEIPIQVQQEFLKQYGETGLDWWDGDTEKLSNWIVGNIHNYKRDRVLNYLRDKGNWGKVLNPVENELAHSLMREIKDGEIIEGCVDTNVDIKDDMLENLQEFCRLFNCVDLFENADVRKPVLEEESSNLDNVSSEELMQEDDIDPKQLLLARINMLGVFTTRTSRGSTLYIKYDDNDKTLMTLVNNTLIKEPGDVEVIAIKDDGKEYSTGIKTSMKAYPKLLTIYVSRRNLVY